MSNKNTCANCALATKANKIRTDKGTFAPAVWCRFDDVKHLSTNRCSHRLLRWIRLIFKR